MKTNRELHAILRNDFKSFVIKVFNEVSGNSTYSDNWHIDVICQELMDTYEGKHNKIIINVPPRHMKSIICSIAFPAFILGHNPKETIICVSYADSLAEKLALDCRNVIESAWYRAIFPHTVLSKSKKGIGDFETTKGGGRFSTSVGGSLTGRGGNIIIIDDPMSPKDANSDTIREKTNDWYSNTLISRLNDKNAGKIIVIMQRTHELDFTGHLLDIDPSFHHITMPAIAEQEERWTIRNHIGKEKTISRKVGEALHSARESLEKLKEIQNIMGGYYFAGQYQQNPVSRGGNIIKEAWFQYYNLADIEKMIKERKIFAFRIGQSWDVAAKAGVDNDYSVCITYLALEKGLILILDVYRDKLEFPDLYRKIFEKMREAQAKYSYLDRPFRKLIIEETSAGIGLIQSLKRDLLPYYAKSVLQPFKPEADKATRLKNISQIIERGFCQFPDDNPPWWKDFKKELITFPNGKHDDQCDALSQLLVHELTVKDNISWLRNV